MNNIRPFGELIGTIKQVRGFVALAGIASFIIAGLILVPVGSLIVRFATSDDLGFHLITQLWTDTGLRHMLSSTLVVVLISTLLAGAIGSFFAWLNERTDARIGWLTTILPVVPLTVPPLAGAIGWILLASPRPGFLNAGIRAVASTVGLDVGTEGPLNIYTMSGLIFVYVLYLVPHVYLTVAAALRNLDSSLEEASEISGASQLKTLGRIVLPSIAPSLAGAGLLALVIGFALFSVPVLIGAPAGIEVLSVRIVRSIITQFPPDFDTAVVLGTVMVFFVGSAWWMQSRLTAASRHATVGERGARDRPPISLGSWRPIARLVLIFYILAASVLPFVALVVVALQPFWRPVIEVASWDLENFQALFGQTYTRHALRNSVLLGATGATGGMLLAAIVAYFARPRYAGVGRWIDGVSKLPGALSHVVLAMGFVAAFVGPPFRLGGSMLLLLGGYLALYMPQASETASSALFRVGSPMFEAARCCSASEGRAFSSIALPLMRPGLIVGWMFLFVLMAGDVTASVMLASTRTPVVGFVMLDLFNNGTYPRLAALGVVISVLTSSVIGVAFLTLKRAESRGSEAGAASQPTLTPT